jgi:hypothetical protein
MTRDELLKLLDEQCSAGADLQLGADRLDEARADICHRADLAWEAVNKNERDRRHTMHRILEVSMGRVDPGPRETK